VLRLLWRFGGRFVVVLAFRLGVRLGVVPSVGVAWALRLLVGAVDARWPAARAWWALRGLAVVVVAVLAAAVWLSAQGYALSPAAAPAPLPRPGWLELGGYGALGLVLAVTWAGVPNAALFLRKGFGDGLGSAETTKQRNSVSGSGVQGEKRRATLRPVSTQQSSPPRTTGRPSFIRTRCPGPAC